MPTLNKQKYSNRFDLFLSYSYQSCDKQVVYKLYEALAAKNVTVWFDQMVDIGVPFMEQLEEGIRASDAMLILFGKDRVGPWATLEMQAGIMEFVSRQLLLIPVLLPGAGPEPELPLFLRGFSWIDLQEDYENGVDRIVSAVRHGDRPTFQTETQPLFLVQHDFLNVLLSEFDLTRTKTGCHLEVEFNHKSPTICTRSARRFLRLNMPNFDFNAKKYQTQLDHFLIDGYGSACNMKDPDFVFRYGNGGTLPIVRVRGVDHFCLFLRGRHPIGWNLANGGADSLEELLDPLQTVTRELREELMIVGPNSFYTFPKGRETTAIDRSEFAIARAFWDEKFNVLGLRRFDQLKKEEISISYIDGPDSIHITFQLTEVDVEGIFINITADDDFGIEVDQVARLILPNELRLGDDIRLLDGEVSNQASVNRPIGLFKVDGFDTARDSVAPDWFFYGGVCYSGDKLSKIISELILPDMIKSDATDDPATLPELVEEFRKEFFSGNQIFQLCPIAKRLIQRYSHIM